MFTRRTSWGRDPNRLSIAVARRRQLPGFIDLTVSNPTRVGLDQSMMPAALPTGSYEPQALGLASAREAIAAYYDRRGIPVDPARVAIVASTSEAYGYLFRLLCEVDEVVSIPKPSYPLFEFLAEVSDVRVAPYSLGYDGTWYLDRTSVSPAKVAIVVSPNNPTGSLLDPEETSHLRASLGELGAIISDEVFADYVEENGGHRRASLIGSEQLTFSLNGLSKVAGLPQHKLGWIVISGPEELVSESLARLEIVADTYLSVSTGIQLALPAILAATPFFQEGLRARIRQNAQMLDRRLAGTPLRARRRQGGWSAFVDLPRTESDEDWALLFVEGDGVAVHPGYLFGAEHGVVVSLIGRPDELDEGMARIVARVQ
ncbi:MAG: pyridoxal phosphate-dependent aminotransferase [Deltaproteobacteria bacterium]|nr:pyridoxal phosphate-dependent aminotransferase [Deltaproteobacteria bacterium]